MAVVYRTADDEYRALRSRYAHELKRLRREGIMTEREYQDWRDDGKLDAAKFPTVRELWSKLEVTWPQTRQGMGELKAASADSPLVTPVDESREESIPLDGVLLAELPKRVGQHLATDIAQSFSADLVTFLVSFRRVRAKLVGVRAYEVAIDGQLGIEVITHD